MQIAYCFIENYINIKSQGISFGSPFLFTATETELSLIIDRIVNPNYVYDLFRRHSDNAIDNVSAIVGQNGSGKTNMMHYLMNAISGHSERLNGFVIFADRHERLRFINHSDKELIFDFEMEEINYKNDFAAIYYNPIYDFQDHYGDYSSKLFNVSSNSLMEEDFRNDEYFSESLDAFSYHKYKNVSRQVRFIISQRKSRIINNYIEIPKEIQLILIDPKFTHESSKLNNVSYDFRPYYQIGVDKWRLEKDNAHKELLNAEKSKNRGLSRYNKKLALIDVLFHVWKFIFYTQERTNSTLREGVVTGIILSNNNQFTELSFEEYIKMFLLNQNVFHAASILAFIDSIKSVLLKVNRVEDDAGFVTLTCNLNQAEHILSFYDVMVNQLSDLLAGKRPNGLLQFSWRSMSSGEKAFLDLFSRIHYAVELINEQVTSQRNHFNPTHVYLLFDEGEVGFHLQWQKEYVKILLDILPRIIRLKNRKIPPHIQLIFTTHSPISLSDIPRYSTIYLSRDNESSMQVNSESNSPKYSFGANVHEIMYDAFYLRDGFTGKFSKEVIDELFTWATNQQKTKDTYTQYARKVINLIDDPILRIKLEELYAKKLGLNTEEAVLKAKIKLMEMRLNNIRNIDKDL